MSPKTTPADVPGALLPRRATKFRLPGAPAQSPSLFALVKPRPPIALNTATWPALLRRVANSPWNTLPAAVPGAVVPSRSTNPTLSAPPQMPLSFDPPTPNPNSPAEITTSPASLKSGMNNSPKFTPDGVPGAGLPSLDASRRPSVSRRQMLPLFTLLTLSPTSCARNATLPPALSDGNPKF